MKFFLSLFTLFSIFCTTLTNAALLNIAPESVEAAAWTIVDTQSGQIIAEHNSHVQRAPASLTKMMVAYIALKEIKAGKLKLNEVITATPVVSVVQWDESQMYLKAGEQISVDQLLAGLIVMSANDAAVTLAEKISGDVPHFVQRMNQEAQALGMKDTHFSNPAGITMPDHYTTAHDLSLLSQAVIHQTPEYLHYSKMPSFSYNQRFHHAMNLAYAYTRDEVVIPEQKLIAELPVIKSTLKMFKVETKQPTIVTTSLYAEPTPIDLNTFDYATQRIQVLDSNQQPKVIAPLETTQTRVNIQLNEQKLTAPLMKAMNLATVSIYQNNQLIRSLQIENDVHIEEANIFQRIMMWFSSLFSIFSSSEHRAAKLYPIDSH
ncbi:TPA: D-alanyl-D-alanine carboxypeptidase family protein [Acinetobacter baumannii]|uniref:D-alanyl-D-alanine carboxypeptidase PBP6B n=1 Tax=Acinetobacter baumannii TaxID=470 RepID=UPI00338DDF36